LIALDWYFGIVTHVSNQSLVEAQIGAELGSNECQWKTVVVSTFVKEVHSISLDSIAQSIILSCQV
jgi:hypothetical protein